MIFRIIKFTINTLLLFLLILSGVYIVFYPTQFESAVRASVGYLVYRPLQFVIVASIVIYVIILIFSFLEKLFNKPSEIKVKSNGGVILVSLNTIESITKNYLELNPIIKQAIASVKPSFSSAVLDVSIECYNSDGLNDKLEEIKKSLGLYIYEMVGFKPRKINFKINKINSEPVVENIPNDTVTANTDAEKTVEL